MDNPLAMSDEDFLKLASPEPAAAEPEEKPAPEASTETPAAQTPAENVSTEEEAPLTDAEKAAAAEGDDEGEPAKTPVEPEGKTPEATQTDTNTPEQVADPKVDTATPAAETPAAAAEVVDYQALYTRMTAPFKANGRNIEVKSPEEAIQLMQMGANYTRKMQELAPHRKVLMMLEKNGLLDEGKLGFLIDIEKKNPDAILKLVKDSGIDPMDLDTSKEVTYREGNHRVSDDEARFSATLEDLKSTPEGLATLQVIDKDWDAKSKDHLWANPEAMETIHKHRASGVYDRITAELDRKITLGQVSPEVPFLQAYRDVGEAMVKADPAAFDDLLKPAAPQAPAAPAAPVVVATRVAAPKPTVANDAAAAAASSSRTTPAVAKGFVNPLQMSDEEFLAHDEQLRKFQGRV